MPLREDIRKVLVIGSGPIVIGQAAEFDYAGTQACKVLKEEGIEVVLVNSNPATIMTDTQIADKVYLEPLNADSVAAVIEKERPDSLLPTLGGQTGLNIAMELYERGVLEEYCVKLLGTKPASIRSSEDREAFKHLLESIDQPAIMSIIATDVQSALNFANQNGYPVIVRPAYTLGGTGGGIANNEKELARIAAEGIAASRVRQILVEKSLAGWKEIEYEVMRDSAGNCITVCSMENFDPVGVHTGDSIVVAPAQTLRDVEHQMLRSAALTIIDALEIEGGCNIQFALAPDSMEYYVIEVNPRVSRSSALASKATGYPIAKVATRIAVGYRLDEILNDVTGKTFACFEPVVDYCVVKIPRWPFDKFTEADRVIGTRMKATGEVMAIGTTFESALNKAVRSLEQGYDSLFSGRNAVNGDLEKMLRVPSSERLFAIAEALRRGVPSSHICEVTTIDPWFMAKIVNIVKMEDEVRALKFSEWTREKMLAAKRMGISDRAIAKWQGVTEADVRKKRAELGVFPSYRCVDTCSVEFEAVSPYYYSCYGVENEARAMGSKTVVVLGSGPIRIGQGVEFDYCSVHCVWALKKAGYDTVIINNNPETVSTDFDTSDRLYFEPLTAEDVIAVLEIEKPAGVMVQFGGQTAIKLAKAVHDAGFKILGTSVKDIDAAEDRDVFDKFLLEQGIERPRGKTVFREDEAIDAANALGYPVLVRPSYVLGGQGMEIAHDDDEIRRFMAIINLTEQEHPILVDKYLSGRELEVDAVCDGEDILIPGIMEHVERAGVHSGDSISVYPPQNVTPEMRDKIIETTRTLAVGLNTVGLVNIQYVIYEDTLYVIEVNPRSSRTVPFISKVTNIPVVELGVRATLGEKLKDMGYGTGLYPERKLVCVKMPVFSFEKLPELEITLGPEMKSTGEAMGIGRDFGEAMVKGFRSTGCVVTGGTIFMAVAREDREEALELARGFSALGYSLCATPGTAKYLAINGLHVLAMPKLSQNPVLLLDTIRSGGIQLMIITPTQGREPRRDGFRLRRAAVENNVPCLTCIDTAKALLSIMTSKQNNMDFPPIALNEIE